MNGATLKKKALAYAEQLKGIKKEIDRNFPWYPYGILNNFIHLEPILAEYELESLTADKRVADIGAADGDLAFFMETLGYTVDVIDHAPTNFNSLRGIGLLKDKLASKVSIHDIDLDSYFQLPAESYDLVFFLGILYHLKNPYFVLESLARRTRHLLVSTRVARFTPEGLAIKDTAVAYLLNPDESNNDATNFWIFSERALKRLFARTGWDVLAYHTVGDTKTSDPARADRDERAFALLRSRVP